MNRVITLDDAARPTGTMDKLAAHQAPGTRHLAFSVLFQAPDGRVLLQRRADSKYHFAGVWANSCCSHPRPGESVTAAATRRVREELGVNDVPDLTPWSAFWYRATDPTSGLAEFEYDIVLTAPLDPDTALPFESSEVAELAWVEPAELRDHMSTGSTRFAPWLPLVMRAISEPQQPIAPTVDLSCPPGT